MEGEAKVERLKMGLISPTRDYFRVWIRGSADQLIKQDPMQEWLFEISPVTNTMSGWLATEATMASDSMSWNIKLAEDVPWNNKNGTDFGIFTATDVAHSHDIWCNPTYEGREDDPSSGYRVGMCQVEDVEIISDYEVNMLCNVPCPDLPFYYSEATDMVQFSKRQWDEEGEMAYESQVAGTGPYVFEEHKLGESVLYKQAPGEHWVHPVDWNELIMTWTLEEATRLAQFEAGETNLTEVNKDLTDQLVNKGYGLVKSTGPAQQVQINFTGLYFGTEDVSREKYVGTPGKLVEDLPFTDIRVRQAINQAIDRETLRLELYKGRVSSSYVHGFYEGLPGWDDTWPDRFDDLYGYDVEAAKALMAEAGYADGFSANAWLFPFPGAPELIPVMEQVQIYLHEIGIDITLTETDWAGTVIPAMGSRDFPGYLVALPPSKKVVETQISGFNAGYNIIHQYETDELFNKWDELRNTAELDERDRLLREIGNIKFENFETIPLFEVFIEVIFDPNIVQTWIFPGWDGGDIGHTWLIYACKTVDPCN
jgi:ABC-type transport system substrate-binding protein